LGTAAAYSETLNLFSVVRPSLSICKHVCEHLRGRIFAFFPFLPPNSLAHKPAGSLPSCTLCCNVFLPCHAGILGMRVQSPLSVWAYQRSRVNPSSTYRVQGYMVVNHGLCDRPPLCVSDLNRWLMGSVTVATPIDTHTNEAFPLALLTASSLTMAH